jgi:ribosome-binding protein aMBF1 (putative translation factor)
MDMNGEKIVDALEEGKIVHVPESYAKREGLAILRRPAYEEAKKEATMESMKHSSDFKYTLKETVTRAPSWREKQVISELVPNFHWQIRMERKKRNLTKAQLARFIGEPEENIKLIEFGKLPTEDFVFINKIQKFFNINLRKDGKNFTDSAFSMLQKQPNPEPKSSPSFQRQPTQQKDDKDSEPDLGIEVIE